MSVRVALYILVFLLASVVFAQARSRNLRQAVLLIGSYALYVAWSPWFVVVLLASTVMNFFFGEWLRKKPSGLVLSVGILLNLALLSAFKYVPPVAAHLPFSSLQRFSHLALPLGISFWTFQAMSYLFDLYREEDLDPTFVEFALYMVFFPVTISGPVCRMPDMLPQFRSETPTRWSDIGRGLTRIATGALMMQLAKLLGQGILAGDGINSAFDHATRWSGADVWCLAFGYGLQLFFDFAGYSHIAIGAAQVLGFTLPENFSHPFESASPSVFWTRWHMSLSFWIRDYVFLPLAVLRREVLWRNLALVISMVVFGLWHKASVLFVLWGCYHGVLLVAHRQVQALQRRFDWEPPALWWTPLSWITTMAVINLGWIFFRADSFSVATQMLSSVLSPTNYSAHFLSSSLYLLVAALAAGYAVVRLVGSALDRCSADPESQPSHGIIAVLARNRWYWIPPIYVLALLFVSIVTMTHTDNAAQFMYRSF
jgi:alginate O-acetyltransferase complex protein AlgI